jgi:hypothetical protein
MKPIHQIDHKQCGSRRENGTERSNRRLLRTDYNYRPTAETQLGSVVGQPVAKLPSFHKLSSEFLGGETSRDYVAELLFFILITGLATWPVMSMLIAVIRLIRNY